MIAVSRPKLMNASEEQGSKPPHDGTLAELWALQFQHFASIASAAVGGVLLLWQIGALRDHLDLGIALGGTIGAVIAALVGQSEVLDGAATGSLPIRRLKRIRSGVFIALGLAVGADFQAIFAG